MNQILITQKLYLTPELKRKKKIYKINFILSIIVILVLTSYYVYAEYDRNKDASISEGILAAFDEKPDENITTEDILVVSLQNDAITIDDGIENDTFDTINEVENTEVEESEKVKTITEPFNQQQEYTKEEMAEVWNNEIDSKDLQNIYDDSCE